MGTTGPRWWQVAAWLVTVTALLAWAELRPTVAAPSLAVGGLVLGVGFALTAVLLVHQQDQRGNASLFALLTLVWVAGQVGLRDVGALSPPLLWLGGFTQVAAAAVLLRYPGDRLSTESRVFVVVCSAVLGALQAALVLTTTPGGWDEPLTPRPWPDAWADPGLSSVLWRTRWAVWAVAAAVFLVLLRRRWRALGAMDRRALSPIMVTASAAGVLILVRFVDELLPSTLQLVIADLRAYSAAAVSIAFAFAALRLKLAQAGIADLVRELDRSASPERVRDALRRALTDPTLEIWYRVDEQEAYVDDRGLVRVVPHDGSRLVVPVADTDREPLAVVLAHPSLARHPRLVDSALAASRLALENTALQAELRSQLVEVRQARSRLLHAGLEQRRQLERDLHDGAQQRLLAVGARLVVLEHESTDPAQLATVRGVRTELQQALDELRDLAHGLYPAILTQGGLAPALEAVIERLPVPVSARVEASRWPPDVESAAYLIVCEALTNVCKHAGPCTAHVSVAAADGRLVLEVSDDGTGSTALERPGTLRTIRDRVDAVGGRLSVHSDGAEGTTVRAELPCA